jgi:hypothetical protein
MTTERVTSPVVIDGRDKEWKKTSAYINKSYALMVRTAHDDNFFYLCLSTRDQEMQMRIFRSGLTVWLDPRGNDNKTFGITFPLTDKMVPGGSQPQRGKKKGVEEAAKLLEEGFLEMEIIGPGDGGHYRLPVTNDEGIAAKIGLSADDMMAYELRVPLHSSRSFPRAINPVVDSIIGLGIESAEVKGPMGQKPGGGMSMGPGGNMPSPPGEGGGMESGGGAPPAGGRMGPGGQPKEGGATDAIKMWWTMKLER